MEWTNEQLIETARVVAKYEGEKAAQLLNELATRFDCALAATRTACAQRDALAAENAGMKSKLMFWDAESPEAPYDTPEEIAEAWALNYNEEIEVQVAARLPNRVYRVCESWDQQCKLELVDGVDVQTPATDAFLAEVRAQGVEMVTYRLKQFIDDGDFVGDEVPLIAGCIDVAADMAAQIRQGAAL
ncbi:hypothetical protein [Scandinavium goeteborgense]|uniref:Ead/Ea22-like family protein n=1 Tax=Scandinavium goeteborgense TaxID=1851514 RepID=A0A4R6ENJ9_SCAGO|nr:hypothetical protein [Scandinavium goeteborgense]TDN60785.1 hypothetical protein EC847_102371 [Scandinavium goeteborgense]